MLILCAIAQQSKDLTCVPTLEYMLSKDLPESIQLEIKVSFFLLVCVTYVANYRVYR